MLELIPTSAYNKLLSKRDIEKSIQRTLNHLKVGVSILKISPTRTSAAEVY
jgi:hypothetical protein